MVPIEPDTVAVAAAVEVEQDAVSDAEAREQVVAVRGQRRGTEPFFGASLPITGVGSEGANPEVAGNSPGYWSRQVVVTEAEPMAFALGAGRLGST